MKIRTKVVLSSLLFIAASSGVGYWCFLNIRREEDALAKSRRALKTNAAVADIDYFLRRQVRALENYVLLSDEAEKLQLAQARGQAQRRIGDWRAWVVAGEADGNEIPAVQSVSGVLIEKAQKIEQTMDAGQRRDAMGLVEKEFTPASTAALAAFDEIRKRTEKSKTETERRMIEVLRLNHLTLLGGVGLVTFFGLTIFFALYRAVIGPVHRMRQWADRVAQGDRSAVLGIHGRNELMDLARSIAEMSIQLRRPRAEPAPLPAANAGPPAPPLSPEPVKSPPKLTVRATPTPSAPKPKGGVEEAVDEFRDILAQMAGQSTSEGRKIG